MFPSTFGFHLMCWFTSSLHLFASVQCSSAQISSSQSSVDNNNDNSSTFSSSSSSSSSSPHHLDLQRIYTKRPSLVSLNDRQHNRSLVSSNSKSRVKRNKSNSDNNNSPSDSSYNSYFSTEPSITNSDENDPGDNYIGDVPEFVDTISNITVAIGREARLTCIVRNLGVFKVAWMRVEDQTILTIHDHIITRNYRIGLSHSELRVWHLIISDAQEEDRGGYMCQVNTVPMLYQIGFLDVVVPPRILTAETSVDVMRRENSNATLTCRARGYPLPKITWRREDGKPIEHGNWQEKKDQGIQPPEEYEGEQLTINKVSRLHMGAYLCIASNGVQPSVSHRIILNVHFPPMIWVPHQLIAASVGSDAVLICNTEASPKSINYWTKDDEDALIQNDKYEIDITSERLYRAQMILKIKHLTMNDFGTFKCYARNSLGSTEGSIKLYEIHSPGGKGARRDPTNARSRSSNGDSDLTNETSSGNLKQSKTMSIIVNLVNIIFILTFVSIRRNY